MKKRSRSNNYNSSSSDNVEYRVNNQIRVDQVRLIDHNGDNHGVVTIDDAAKMAQDVSLDLVEVSPNSDPPVCRIMDYGKFVYEKARKERDARKNQKQVEIKTVRLRPKTAKFHRDISVKNSRRWLGEGKKVKVMVRFQRRERDYPEIAQDMLTGIATELSDVSDLEQSPMMDGWTMVMVLTPEKK